ncbi:uncharacterized protein LOC124369893 [Homalodisca vitripennis]|uniref:uncharacterized protein LOC124369893 n=1 Tax=Homalodisca vitripennis TaxID=197043 RepID=UPI001EEC0750|nr:uncharacterized protein LOC124369893 [Homalodisca vitripennis]
MPLKHQPNSLRKIALRSICRNFNKLFYRCQSDENMRVLIDTGAYMEFENPLQELPPNMLEDLAEEMKRVTHLRSHHLHMFITENLQEWSFSGSIADHSMAFHMLSTRCKKLKHLNLSYMRTMNHMVFLMLVPTLANIVSLDLRMTLTVDEVVNKIGECCHSLVDLNLSSTPITDKGLVYLCISQNGQRRCQQLARLSVSETWISALGATVVLHFLPNIREFDFDNIFEAIEGVEMVEDRAMQCLFTRAGIRLSELDTDITAPTRLRLTCLNSTVEYLREEALDATVRLCPDATNVAISNAWLPNEALYKLMLLEHLTALSLTNGEGCTFTFHEGVMPVLSVCGPRLHSLILSNFPGIDISGVGSSCPNLQNLAFSNVPVFEVPSKLVPEWFNKLEALELWSATSVEYSPQLVKQLLLYSPIIKNILFNSCSVVTDSLLLEIMQSNPMEMLSHLTVNHCHGVTMATIESVLDAKNDLNVLRVWSCASITRLHSVQVSQRISEENLDVYFEWFEFT